MFTLSLTLLALLLSNASGHTPAPTPAADIAAETAVVPLTSAVASARCPLSDWAGPCAYMADTQKDLIRQAVLAHANVSAKRCRAAQAALFEWLGDGRQAWVFETHRSDDAALGAYVLGETAHYADGRAPAGFGLRAAVFSAADPRTLARIALHEGAHLAGADEAGAELVDSTCTSEEVTSRSAP
ncbi:hypothetical protein BH23GEM3_BH23GEM3_00340 [soil metagenome]